MKYLSSLPSGLLLFAGIILGALGLMLLFKTWQPANFRATANVRIMPRLLLSAMLIWVSMGITFKVFGLLP